MNDPFRVIERDRRDKSILCSNQPLSIDTADRDQGIFAGDTLEQSSSMDSVLSATRLLHRISSMQFYRYLERYVRQSPSATRATKAKQVIPVPSTPGVGLFLYPPDSWSKERAFAVGPLGSTSERLHPSKFQIARNIGVADKTAPKAVPELLYWGFGGSVNIVKSLTSGVTEGFAMDLELHGVGYRAEEDTKRNMLVLRLGLSHPVEFPLQHEDVFLKVRSPQVVQVAGINRGKVHGLAAKIRAVRPPEPYKGKGIRYQRERVRRKETKKSA